MTALFAFSMFASAGVKNLYKQDFESTKDPAAIGWVSPNYAGGMSIISDEYGSYFQFDLGTQNNRNCNLVWLSKVNYEGITKYEVDFSWALAANANGANGSQYSNEVCLFTDETSQVNNGQMCAAAKAHWLFVMTQKKGTSTDETIGDMDFYINNNQDDIFTPEVGFFYNFIISVDTEARTASYRIENSLTAAVVKEGVYALPEEWSALASGINILAGRYGSKHQLDDIVVKSVIDGDFANDPTVAMTGIDMKKRTFLIMFDPANGEELHIKGTDGTETTSVESPYTYTTETSGTLEVWTKSGTAESNHITTEVICEEIALPGAEAALIGVGEGYIKTYKLSVSNAEVPTQPQLFIDVEYTGEGGESQVYSEQMSGFEINVEQKGTLKLTTKAYGFASTTVSIVNDKEFAVDATIDFQHMDEATLKEKGFIEKDVLDSDVTSGETNWTARKRMYFQIKTGEKDEEGNDLTTTQVVYGPSAQGFEPIRRFQFKQSELTETKAHELFAPVYTWWLGLESATKGLDAPDGNGNYGGTVNPKINYGIGLVHSGVLNDDESYDPAGKGYGTIQINEPPMGVDGLTDDDFIIVYKIDNYGGGSVHPVYEAGTTVEEGIAKYKAEELGGVIQVLKGTETFSMYRVDTAISCIKTFKAKNGSGIEELPYNKIVSDHNAPIYNMNGVQVNANALKKGIYVKQGKKFIVR